MKISISVGEHSADMHGANLVNAIKKINPEISFFGFGGKYMKEAGVDIEYDLTKLAIIGFVEPIKKYFFLKKLLFKFVEKIKIEKPDILILMDYPGFNLKLAEEIFKLDIPIYYYIAPQVWAWGYKRIEKIKKYIKKVIVILPFEVDIYKNAGIDAVFEGHPIVDVVKPTMSKEDAFKEFGLNPEFKIIGIFPGSRTQEVKMLLPAMHKIANGITKRIKKVQFVIALSPSIEIEDKIIDNIRIVRDKQYDVMNVSDLLIAASGTVTLEATLMETPIAVLYKLNRISFALAKILAKVKYVSLVNIIKNRKIIPEYIQNFKINDIIEESIKLLYDEKLREQMKLDLSDIAEKLGEKDVADRVARIILEGDCSFGTVPVDVK